MNTFTDNQVKAAWDRYVETSIDPDNNNLECMRAALVAALDANGEVTEGPADRVEQVARELAISDGKDPDALSHNSFQWWRHYVPQARAVVAIPSPRKLASDPLYTRPSTPVSAEVTVTDAVRDVLAERRRQVEDEGWTPEHDDTHVNGEMARASGLYALIAGSDATTYRNAIGGYALNDFASAAMRLWPWSPEWFKPKDRRRDMVKSVALGIAEIERLDRAALATLGGGRG